MDLRWEPFVDNPCAIYDRGERGFGRGGVERVGEGVWVGDSGGGWGRLG